MEYTFSSQEKILDLELSKIENKSNIQKGTQKNALYYHMDLPNGIELSVSKLFDESKESLQYVVSFALSCGTKTLLASTLDVRELVRKCNELDFDCLKKD